MGNIKKIEEYANKLNFLDIIKEFKLEEHLKNILNDNKSNYAPYHNINHLLCVTKHCYLFGKEEGLNKNDLKLIVIAGMYHDFNHSAGKKTDDKNIAEAIKVVKKYVDEKDQTNVIKIIEATQFPYVIEDKDLSQTQEIIRDADMMQTFEDNFLHQVVFGLAEEFGKNPVDFLKDQKSFISGLKFYTKTATDYTKTKLKNLKDDVDYLIKITK